MSDHTRAVATIAIFIAIIVAVELLKSRAGASADAGQLEARPEAGQMAPSSSSG